LSESAVPDRRHRSTDAGGNTMSKGAKLAYKPVSMVGGVLAGAVAGAVVKRVWVLVAGDPETPSALGADNDFWEVVLAAALQGAVFAATRTAVDRAGAIGFRRVTGAWPGD
jgi:hypothetical protein